MKSDRCYAAKWILAAVEQSWVGIGSLPESQRRLMRIVGPLGKMMITKIAELSPTAKIFYKLLQDKSPELLDFAIVQSPSTETPLIEEPGSIVILIPAGNNFIADKIYIETRKEDILVAVGNITHSHFSWYSPEVMEEYMLNAIRYVDDILTERRVFIRSKSIFQKNGFVESIPVGDLKKKKRIIAIYSWKGTYTKLGNTVETS